MSAVICLLVGLASAAAGVYGVSLYRRACATQGRGQEHDPRLDRPPA